MQQKLMKKLYLFSNLGSKNWCQKCIYFRIHAIKTDVLRMPGDIRGIINFKSVINIQFKVNPRICIPVSVTRQFAQGHFAHGQFTQKNGKIKLKKPKLT